MRRPGLPISCFLRVLPLLLFASLFATPAVARNPNPEKYPLRVHVLASDTSYRTPRMSPGDAVVCDAIDSALTSMGPNSGGSISVSGPLFGLSGDACSLHPEMITGRLLDIQDYDPVFSGEGRADLVSPPAGTQGFSFHYDNCGRMRVPMGLQSLPARWKRPGKKLEVLIPSDEIPVNGRPLPPARCTLTVTVHDYIYLLLRNGAIVQVSQEVYWKRPALRVFLSGNTQAIQERPKQFTVPVNPSSTN